MYCPNPECLKPYHLDTQEFCHYCGSKLLLQDRFRYIKLLHQTRIVKTFLGIDTEKYPPSFCIIQQVDLQNQKLDILLTKAQKLEQLGQHPQIPKVLTYFQDNQYFYLVCEFVEGKNLATLLAEEGTFSESRIWQILADILPILQLLHSHNLIHGNIKPENIVLRYSPSTTQIEGNFVLIGNQFLESGGSLGSPEYAAPEQTQGQPVFASDLYSLGVACIYLLTQISPFDLFDVTNNCWVWRQYLTIKVSDRLGKIIDKLIETFVNLRFQSADEVMQAIGIHSSIQNLKSKIQNPVWECLHTLTGYPGNLSSVNSVAISPGGDILASGHDDKTTKLWNLNTKKLIFTLAGHSQAVKSVAFSPDGKILATASDDKTIKLWNLSDLETRHSVSLQNTLFGHSSAVKSVAFSLDGILASGSWDKTVKLWNIKTGQEISTLSGHQLQVSAVAFSPQSQLLASASFDRTVRLWDLSSLHTQTQEELKNCLCYCLCGHAWAVLTVAFSPDGKILATGSDDNTIKLWDVNTGQVIRTLLGHSWSVLAVAFSADSETLVSGSRDNTIKLWRVSTGKEFATLTGHLDSVSAVAVNPVAQLIMSGSRDKTIKIWQFAQQ